MTRDDGGGGGGPYQGATDQNTSTGWLDDFTKVDAKLDGMSDYAKTLADISDRLNTHRIRLIQQISSVLSDGAFMGGFPEVNYAATLHGQNFSEFNQYLQNLYDGIAHSGNAAQAIADSYGDKDGFSAISLNDVRFAFGDPDATRPAGLPSFYGETFSQQEAKAAAAAAKAGKTGVHQDAIWTLSGSSGDDAGNSYLSYVDQYGDTRTISVVMAPNGHKITTMTGPDGKTVQDETGYSYEFGSYATTTSTGPDGKVSTTVSNTTYAGDTTTTAATTDGRTTVTTVTSNPDGSRTTSTYTVDGSGKRTLTQQVTIGQDNPVQLGAPDSPSNDALQADNAVIQKGDDAKNTQILAPGPPANTSVADLGGGAGHDAGAPSGTTSA